MKLNNIRGHIRSICLKKLIYPVAVLLLAAFIFWRVPFAKAWNPAVVTEPPAIIDLYEENIYYVQMTADTLYYTGYDYVENGKIIGSYYYNVYEGTCIFYLLSSDMTNGKAEILNDVHIKARLEGVGKTATELMKQMAADLDWTYQGIEEITLDVVVNENDYLLTKMLLLLAVNAALALIALMDCAYLLLHCAFPSLYLGYLKLGRYGRLKTQLLELENELLESEEVFGELIITKNYLIECSKYSLQVIPLEQIIWAYKHSNFHRFRFTSMKLTYTLRVIGKGGMRLIASGQGKSDVDEVLEYLERKNPDIRIGYSRENDYYMRRQGRSK